jgi:hypothetical protein
LEPPEQLLRKLTIRDDALLAPRARRGGVRTPAESSLDAKTHALVCVSALIAMDAAAPSYLCAVESARAAGRATTRSSAACCAWLPILGEPRVVSAAPKLGLALGYDVRAALEEAGTALG